MSDDGGHARNVETGLPPLPADVVRLVVAARNVADLIPSGFREEIVELADATEAFASRVPWEDDPQSPSFDYEITDDGVMRALDTWERNDHATHLRLMLVADNNVTEDQIAAWTDDQVKAADCWAWTTTLDASDNNGIQVPPRPDFITRVL